jgi:CBS domain containing-hemolysin-like protein
MAQVSGKGVLVSLEESNSGSSDNLIRWLRRSLRLKRRPLELKEVIDEGEERGLIDEDEGEMIEGIFDLKQTVAREIMIPRTHLVCLPNSADREQVLTTIIDSGHSRIPVYGQNVDQILGILYAKDLLPLWLRNEEEFSLEKICREPFFVPETKRIKDLLGELRTRKSHLAVIVDEYGGTSGIVTIEDIIEEIIGEISDEHDVEEVLFVPQEDGSVLVSARVSVDDFEERFAVSLPRGGYDTLGGFIIHFLGKVPGKGEEMVYGGLSMKIAGGDEKRIIRVMVRPLPTTGDENSTAQPESSP